MQAGDTRLACRFLVIDGNQHYLQPLNLNLPASLVAKQDQFAGTVRQIRVDYG